MFDCLKQPAGGGAGEGGVGVGVERGAGGSPTFTRTPLNATASVFSSPKVFLIHIKVICRDANVSPLLLSCTSPWSCRDNQAQATLEQQLDLPEEAPSAVRGLPGSRERLIEIEQGTAKIIGPLRGCFRRDTNRYIYTRVCVHIHR